ncbi:hypothetical protein Bca101_097168 [Brassica carinata]
MTEYKEEQEMEIEALESILADDFKGDDDDLEESSIPPGYYSLRRSLMPLICFFSVLELSNLSPTQKIIRMSIRGIHVSDLTILKEKLEQEAAENLGMAMMYTLVSSAKDWLSEHYGQDDGDDYAEEETAKEDEALLLLFLMENLLRWRRLWHGERDMRQSLHLSEPSELMPESALTAPKEKKLTGRQWFESGKARGTVVAADQESEEEDDEDIDFEDDDFEDDEEDMLEHYLAEKSDARA